MTGPPNKYNPARRQAEALVNLARSYLRESLVKKAAHDEAKLLRAAQAEADEDPRRAQAAMGPEALRLAAEALPLDVEVLIEALIRALPDDTRAGATARASVMHRLAGALANAAIIGSWHFDAGKLHDKARRGLAMSAVRKGKDKDKLFEQLKAIIRERQWSQRSAAFIHDRIGNTFGRVGYPSETTLKRALRKVRSE